MPLDTSVILTQIDRAIDMYDSARRLSGYEDLSGREYPDTSKHEVLNVLMSTLQRVAPKNSSYWKQFSAMVQARGSGLAPVNLPFLVGILRALRGDVAAGYVVEIEETIHADIFSDFLEMAEHLLDTNFKDPAAVMIGGVLEEHLRKLAIKNGITVTNDNGYKKADTINGELGGIPVYNKLDQKTITAWLDLRNKAAHGQYSEYVREQVSAMLLGVRNFLSRFPA